MVKSSTEPTLKKSSNDTIIFAGSFRNKLTEAARKEVDKHHSSPIDMVMIHAKALVSTLKLYNIEIDINFDKRK